MIILSDFDGTLTTDKHQIDTTFFEILDHIKKSSHELIIVSGRSVSWGHFLLTHFPLETCIMEGGGVLVKKNKNHQISHSTLIDESHLKKLEKFTRELQHHYPGLPLSVDSFGRLSDRAIEYHQMNKSWVDEVIDFMKRNEISFSKSNVHINFWSGEISKYLGVKKFLREMRPKISWSDCWFFGDAPNDESMFEHFPNTVGVSNISSCLDRLNFKPKIILEGEENQGPRGVLNFIKALS